MPNCDLFTSQGYFIVFWERDITSEHHRTPVHITTTVYTIYLLSVFTFPLLSLSIIIIPCVLSFVKNKAGGIDNSSVLVGSKAICVCAGPGEASDYLRTAPHLPNHLLVDLGVLRETILKPRYLHRGKLAVALHLTFHLG